MELPLNSVAFRIGPISVHWYGIFMAISIGVGMYYLYKKAVEKGYDDDFLTNLLLLVVIFGIIGARLMFVITNTPGWFVSDPIQILKVYEGGLSWHGAVLGGFLAGLWYCRKKGKRINPLEDYAVVGLAVGNILVRIGNIFNHEVLGRTTQFTFGRWPDQLVGVAIGIILLIRYFYLQKKDIAEGYQFWSYIFYYQLIRGVVEETFKDTPLLLPVYYNKALGIGLLTTTQVATPFVLLFTFWMMQRVKKDKNLEISNS
ncbi:prolipoprotein diacylglyceryl transferase [Caldanaerobius polysaccharolyticus]|uniref:prolipoprotein diacylglyceryl transferase n=1 Tax=Caldanaerobius polysaccharolyticus TaxID=44256 RepID=UPI00047D5575|nr:prolipoprotein diacylglyceryl transferase [Caldanaerobius polysaccharolyticus]